MKSRPILSFILLAAFILGWSQIGMVSAQEATPGSQAPFVRAVMFWKNGCPNCAKAITEVLPPIKEKYGEQFQIHFIQMKGETEIDLIYKVGAALGVAKEEIGTPFLIIGDRPLLGPTAIQAELPGIIEEYLATGGVDYPDQVAFEGFLPDGPPDPNFPEASVPESETEAAAQSASSSVTKSNGYTLAIGIMVAMAAALVYAIVRFMQPQPEKEPARALNLATPLLSLVGLGVAGYLAYVETQAVSAVCGPIGDCNAVQSSPYATLFGILPIGVLGLIAYAAILGLWLWKQRRKDWVAQRAALIIFGMAVLGTLFSLYLTYLEPFVIKAVCAWCLSSAVIITLIMLVNIRPAQDDLAGKDTELAYSSGI